MKNISAIILSSGLSERMGQPKALLNWDRSTTFIEKIIGEFERFGCKQIICMINENIEPTCKSMLVSENVKFVVNHHPDWGRFYSIRTGLNEIIDSDYCFIHNVDNPFVKRSIVKKLCEFRNPESWCSPEFKGRGGHPVLLSNSIIKKIVEVEDLSTTLADLLSAYPRVRVEVDNDFILRNINSPEDYASYFENKK